MARQYIVRVTTADHEGSGTNVIGPFTASDAEEVYGQVVSAFAVAKAQYGDRAFPYGEPEVAMDYIIENWTAADLARNWVFSYAVNL